EDVLGEEDSAPGVGREGPLDVAVSSWRQEGIDKHDEERTDGPDCKQEERGEAEKPAAPDLLSLASGFGEAHLSPPAPGPPLARSSRRGLRRPSVHRCCPRRSAGGRRSPSRRSAS